MFGGAYIRWEIYAMKLIGCATGSFLFCFICNMKKFLHADWLRACQLIPNSAET